MLEDLTVRDFALIESVSLEFRKGLNVLTGETGAGKSILIGSLSFLFGGKTSQDFIRTGAEEARVSGTIYIDPLFSTARLWLSEHGIQLDNDRVLLRRSLRTSGKNASWIQDVPVTRNELAEFTSQLVDIHGQHDHQSLLKVPEHRRFLDSFAGLNEKVSAFTELYSTLAAKRRQRDEMNISERERNERIELLQFAIDEIQAALLLPNEETELEIEEQRLSQHEKLFSHIETVSELVSGQEGIVSLLKKSRIALDSAADIDQGLSSSLSRIENVYYELDDLGQVLRQYQDSLVFDPKRLEQVEERLAVIFRLKKKYGNSIDSIFEYLKSSQEEIEQISALEENRHHIDSQIATLEKQLYSAGTEISDKRKEKAQTLQIEVEKILKNLGMAGTSFVVQLTVREGSDTMQISGPFGFDIIEFMISANRGEPLKPLARIASGGELSRVMLALKTVLAGSDDVDTLIFDEIDTGIGGEVALAVGAHLKELADQKQTLCITHLASIAVRADNQIKIEKSEVSGKTIIRAFTIEGQPRVEEIARMLAGDGYSTASLEHASELLSRFGSK
ncbi:MAG TPA: DNA repair protein RecN [Treponemataceae bacterium]|nr:DNA repair protein RecN [Treponemataceae bacterium]